MRNWFTNRRKTHRWQRNVSLVLLLFCFYDMVVADVLFPGSCEREGAMIPSSATPASDQQRRSTRADVEQEQHQTPADSMPVEDDCFCCCAHIVPAESYNVPPLLFHPPSIESHPGSIPATPFADLFRPPRFA